VERLAVNGRVDGDGGNAHFFARPDNPQGNFSSIGDQNF
jgi:hypothetical protein